MDDPKQPVSRRDFARMGAAAAVGAAAGGAPAPAQAQEVAPLESTFLLEILLDTEPGIDAGPLRIVPVSGGTFAGPRLRGTVMPGADWITTVSGDSRLDVRIVLVTDDGAHISMTYRGIIAQQEGGGRYWRATPVFSTAAERYDWLNHIVSVARSKQVAGKVAYDVFQIL
jgi:hypothetical protein